MTQTLKLYHGSNLDSLKLLTDASIDSVVTDPPYGLSAHSPQDITDALTAWLKDEEYTVKKKGFMGKTWDSFVPGPELWKEVYRVLKPGGHVLCFAGSRTQDLMTMALCLGGFEIRDTVMWIYGSGFPKSYNVAKGVEGLLENGSASWNKWRNLKGEKEPVNWGYAKLQHEQHARPNDYTEVGQQRIGSCDYQHPEANQWDGWGTALKPAHEPIIMARKPLDGTVAANVLKHGTGALNIDASRVPISQDDDIHTKNPHTVNLGSNEIYGAFSKDGSCQAYDPNKGRWPANVIHDGSEEVEEAFAAFGTTKSGVMKHEVSAYDGENVTTFLRGKSGPSNQHGDSGSVSRFFYNSKASKADRAGSKHPTVKPISLMRYLVKLVTPPNGVVLDPFAGSGTTGQAALQEGFNPVLMERETEYVTDIANRIAALNHKDLTVAVQAVAPAPAAPTSSVTQDATP